MNLDTFIHNLHFKIDKINPVDWEVDWEDAPLPYKLYRNLPVFPLSLEIPFTLEKTKVTEKPGLSDFGYFLWYVYGLNKFCQSVYSTQKGDLEQVLRRFVPSGGALYPNELYVYLKIEKLPDGVYHYDVAHHRLVLLRKGNFDLYLTETLGGHCNMSTCFGTIFISTVFWKNFFKYNNFSYRLQGLDTGVLIGQLLEVAKRFGFESGVYFQFLDRAVNHLLGLSEQEETIYTIIPLSINSETTWFTNNNHVEELITATNLSRRILPIHHDHYVRSKRILEHPMLTKMNEASMIDSMKSFQEFKEEMNITYEVQTVSLPNTNRLSFDLALASRIRHSPGMDFTLGKINQLQLATLLHEATSSFLYRNDLDGDKKNSKPRVSIYGCTYGIEGIPDGAWYYDSSTHTLRYIRYGDYRYWLEQGMSLDDVNIFQTPLCLHLVGYQDYHKTSLGYRGYRIQQMEAGMLLQRILLVSSAIGIGGHPLLGFNVGMYDEIYKITSQNKTSLIQIPVGPNNPPLQMKGGLFG
ncbi:SagB family peptide dehydrogenase [Oceanobacillus salinisoli]|uniref:SagB family peptide dehydrogenase n=1 Tax=Oceanobacillus salinisoli TaxID=2678611 RepID=UPI0012E174E8|nr:SagB family peptide dehydrogenase [Oceanobacillus salinisoli]